MAKRGVLTVVSGFSGAGKGTIMKELVSRYDYALSISATTRNPRQGEVNGVDYFYMTKQEFEEKIKMHGFIEYAKYVDNYYGTPRDYVEKQLEDGKDVILEIEIQGALKVKEQYPDVLLLFITPPTAYELRTRLVGRGTEDEETIQKRLTRAKEESQYMKEYDYIVVNDKLEECVEFVHTIIRNKHSTISYCQDNINTIVNELQKI